jgi:hypothetical protein
MSSGRRDESVVEQRFGVELLIEPIDAEGRRAADARPGVENSRIRWTSADLRNIGTRWAGSGRRTPAPLPAGNRAAVAVRCCPRQSVAPTPDVTGI